MCYKRKRLFVTQNYKLLIVIYLTAECKTDNDCPYDKSCINEYCLNPCTTHLCGRGAECFVQSHFPQCRCPLGTQGNPQVACITGVCQYNEDCADHEACDRLNRICRPVCDSGVCANTAICTGRRHQPECTCPAGNTGDPYVQCSLIPLPIPVEPECRNDADCPSQLACINAHCQNPCSQPDVCSLDQQCRILDTLPLRTIICQCLPDTIVDANGRCRNIIQIQPACTIDPDCPDSDKCIRGECVPACRFDQCGINALCSPINHQAVCTCASGYTGNPHRECTNSKYLASLYRWNHSYISF